MMKKFFLGIILSLSSVLGCQAQIFPSTISWTHSAEALGSDEYLLTFTGEILDGWHTYGLDDEYSATSISFSESSGMEVIGSASYEYEDNVLKIFQRVGTTSDDAVAAGNIHWRSCKGDLCRSPEDFDFSFPVISPADAGEAGTEPVAGNIWSLILEAILWGFAMLLTPCVFPMVPMTVSFFLKDGSGAVKGRFKAAAYGLCIVLLYTVPICIIIGATLLFGGQSVTADIFNWLSTHWLPNILFFLVFMFFAASFFGAFEIVLPSRWVNASDKKSDSNGLAGVFFLALTLVLVSFSCTGPIVGTVLIKSTAGEFWAPMVTMLAFSIAFALPFVLLALFPSLLGTLPRSGGWLNSVKVVLGFIEIALGLKFLSTADQTYHWGLLDRPVYLAVWIVCFSLLGFYLLGKLRFRNDTELKYISVWRLFLAIADFSFVLCLLPGLWGAPLKALSGYLPPMETQDFVLGRYAVPVSSEPVVNSGKTITMPQGLSAYTSLDDAMEAASASGKHIFVDITGYGCVNCREMESRVWSDPEVRMLLAGSFEMLALYTDDKTVLPESEWVTLDNGRVLKDAGRINSYLVQERFGVSSQPAYIILDKTGKDLSPVYSYDLSVPHFLTFLREYLR